MHGRELFDEMDKMVKAKNLATTAKVAEIEKELGAFQYNRLGAGPENSVAN